MGIVMVGLGGWQGGWEVRKPEEEKCLVSLPGWGTKWDHLNREEASLTNKGGAQSLMRAN